MAAYKPAKTLDEQIKYLKENKKVCFNIITEKRAKDILFRYNYINVITPFKHHFAKLSNKNEVIKENGNHVYENDVEFSEYYELYKSEREKYPTISKNIISFETIFKSIFSYRILTMYTLESKDDVIGFLDVVRIRIPNNNHYSDERIHHMNKHIDEIKDNMNNYHDVYCFFDRMSLGQTLTVYCGLEYKEQDKIFNDCKKAEIDFGVDKTPDFISKFFTLIAVRNCVMHCNSLEILIRFYNPKTKTLRDSTNKKRFTTMIKYLSKEKDYTDMV